MVPRRRGGRPGRQAAARPGGSGGKPLASRYHPGRRRDWIKIKNTRHQEVIICGWQPGQGRRANTIGSLLMGLYDDGRRLRYAGNVGTGVMGATLRELMRQLGPLQRERRQMALPGQQGSNGAPKTGRCAPAARSSRC